VVEDEEGGREGGRAFDCLPPEEGGKEKGAAGSEGSRR